MCIFVYSVSLFKTSKLVLNDNFDLFNKSVFSGFSLKILTVNAIYNCPTYDQA